MKRSGCFGNFFRRQAGFSFVEVAVALIILGLLAGAGMLLLGKTVDSTQRKETVQRLQEAKSALLLYAGKQGKLPLEAGYFKEIGSSPIDTWKNLVTYKVSPNIDLNVPNQLDVCRRAKNPDIGYAGWAPGAWIKLTDEIKGTVAVPVVYAANGAGEAAAALLVSGGARDADNLGGFFDGYNGSGLPNYERKYPSETFDDIVVVVTVDEFYEAIRDNFCMATVTVTDARISGGGVYYVHDNTTNTDIGSANLNGTVIVRVPFDELLVIRDAPGGLGVELNAQQKITVHPTAITFL